MKTRYLAEAQTSLMLNQARTLTNPYFTDVFQGIYFVGLLSSLPLEAKDGWQGAGELFHQPDPTLLAGIKPASVTTGGYRPIEISRVNFLTPTLVASNFEGLSGVLIEYQAQIDFPTATADWGIVKGVVIYATRALSGQPLRVTPLLTLPFHTPVEVTISDELSILNTGSARMRSIELIKKNAI